jgi:predicted DsbA family dithiol-disulfide isomerase
MLAHQDQLSRDGLIGLAERAGLDTAAFRTALDQHAYRAAVNADKATAATLEIQATPAFVINGKRVIGNRPVAQMRAVIDQAIAEL